MLVSSRRGRVRAAIDGVTVLGAARRHRDRKRKAPQIRAGQWTRESGLGGFDELSRPKATTRSAPRKLRAPDLKFISYGHMRPTLGSVGWNLLVGSELIFVALHGRRKRASTALAGKYIARPKEAAWCERPLIGRAFPHRRRRSARDGALNRLHCHKAKSRIGVFVDD